MRADAVAIVPSAGLGKRFDSKRKKTFVHLEGAPLFIRTLQRLQQEACITEIIPALGADDIETGYSMLKEFGISKVKKIAQGGSERQDSIYNALKTLSETHLQLTDDTPVLIHDGVRPFIPEGQIETLISGLEQYDGIAPGIPVKETLKEIRRDGTILTTVDRKKIRAIQTPQAFLYSTIIKAYEMAYKRNYYGTDDASLVEKAGGTVKIISGSPYNIKVTTPEDMEMLEFIFTRRHKT